MTGATGSPAGDAGALTAEVLALVLERGARSSGELAEAVGAAPAEVAGALAALDRRGLVASEGGAWRPGPAAVRFARRESERAVLVEAAQPVLRRLAEESGETANLVVPRASGTESLAQVDGRHLLGATNWIGRELPLHCTAAGKVFLAFGASVLPEGPLSAPGPATIVDRDRLANELATVRAGGYATIIDELEDGLAAAGAPVRDGNGDVIAALTVSGATLRLPPARLALLGRVALEQARALSGQLGYGSGA